MKEKRTRIMVFGTFDGVHEGHRDFFSQAKSLVPDSYLIVSVARDLNVKKIKKFLPDFSENARMALVRKTKLPDKVVLGGVENHIPHIIKEAPHIIALGYDQRAYIKNLKKDLENKGLIVRLVRLKPYKETVFKNHLLKKKLLL